MRNNSGSRELGERETLNVEAIGDLTGSREEPR